MNYEQENISYRNYKKEEERIAKSIIAYISRQSTSYEIAEKALELALDGVKKDLILYQEKATNL